MGPCRYSQNGKPGQLDPLFQTISKAKFKQCYGKTQQPFPFESNSRCPVRLPITVALCLAFVGVVTARHPWSGMFDDDWVLAVIFEISGETGSVGMSPSLTRGAGHKAARFSYKVEQSG